MEKQAYNRWVEVSFYYFCFDIINNKSNIQDIFTTIEGLAHLGNYDIIPLQALTQRILSTYAIQPTREELVLLCHKANMPVKDIMKLLRISNRSVYNIVEDDKTNPRAFFPRLSPEETLLVDKFMTCVQKIKKAGL